MKPSRRTEQENIKLLLMNGLPRNDVAGRAETFLTIVLRGESSVAVAPSTKPTHSFNEVRKESFPCRRPGTETPCVRADLRETECPSLTVPGDDVTRTL